MKRILLFDHIPFDVIDRPTLLSYIISFCVKRQKRKVFNMNTYGAVLFMKHAQYRNAILDSDIIYPDGWGPVVASWFFPHKLITRVNVGDFIDDLLNLLNKNHLSLYLLGCEEKTVVRTAKTIQKKYPSIRIAGYQSGFFNHNEEKTILSRLKKAKPNLVLIGMGIPKQELFIMNSWPLLPKAVYMGIGGVFYYISKQKSRAPLLLRTSGLEWMYRFVQEPKRLWHRYTVDNIYFLWLFLKFLFQYYVFNKRAVGSH